MAVKCKGCEAKDDHIKYLQKIIEDLIAPFKQSNQIFIPKYINEAGDIIEVGEEDDLIDIEDEIADEDKEFKN